MSLLSDQVGTNTGKANALIALTLTKDFAEQPESVKHDYFWVVNDLIERAKNTSEQILNALLKGAPFPFAADATKNNST